MPQHLGDQSTGAAEPRSRRGLAVLAIAALLPLAGAASTQAAPGDDPGTERVSVATGGVPGNGNSHGVDVSADGSVVAFGSAATNLVDGGTALFDIYVRDRDAGVTEVVSVGQDGSSASSTSLWPSISADGTRVAFHSIARNLVPGDDNNDADVFVRDRAAGTTTLVSAASDGGVANGRSQRADISADGKHVVFESSATDIVPGVPANTAQVYIHHLETGETELVSQSTGGAPSDRSAGQASVSGDGRYVVFRTFATNLVTGPPFGYIYVRDTVSGTTTVVEGSSSLQDNNPSISADGEWIFYTGTRAVITPRVNAARTSIGLPVAGTSLSPSRLSADGRFAAYFGRGGRLYVYDRVLEANVEASLTAAGDPVASGAVAPQTFGPPGISDDGRIVGFWTFADGVVEGDTGGIEDVFVRDRGDILGPSVSTPTVGPEPLLATEPVVISATADDSSRGGAIIAGAEVSVSGGEWTAMEAADGAFDQVSEDVQVSLEGLSTGGQTACVRATDGRGNTTAVPVCTDFVLESTSSPLAISILRVATDPSRALPFPFDPNKTLFARVWAVPTDGSLPNAGDWDYDTRADDDANDRRYRPGEIEPFGTHGEMIRGGTGKALVSIEAGLAGPGGGLIDLNPRSGFVDLRLTVDLETGEWSNIDGLVPYPTSCIESPASRDADTIPGELCFAVSTLSTSGDMDGDGLLDLWETVGVNTDTDAAIELDLAGWGAKPDHKDLFVEYDVEDDAVWDRQTQEGLIAVRFAFARAPVDAGGIANPDGKPGINVWIDAPPVIVDGQPTTDSRRLALAGANNGERISTGGICGVDDAFYDAKARNFDDDRRWVFRYGIKESEDSGLDCPGGQAEIGGNDLVVLNGDRSRDRELADGTTIAWPGGETFMHELGHTLGLRHGGFENANHKPNYVSLMNYSYSFTLRQTSTGEGFLDFSPALPPAASTPILQPGPRPPLLAALREASPPQGTALGPDRDHELLYASFSCAFTSIPATSPFDLWPALDSTAVLPHAGVNGDLGELPDSCQEQQAALTVFETHADHDDWSNVAMSFHQSGYSADGPVDPSDDEDLPTDEGIEALRAALTTTDLSVQIDGPGGPVTVGETFSATATASNEGTVSALSPEVTVSLGDGLSLVDPIPGCSGVPLVCTDSDDLKPLAPGEAATIALTLVADSPGSTAVDVAIVDRSSVDDDTSNDAASLDVEAREPASDNPGDDSGTSGEQGDSGSDGNDGGSGGSDADAGNVSNAGEGSGDGAENEKVDVVEQASDEADDDVSATSGDDSSTSDDSAAAPSSETGGPLASTGAGAVIGLAIGAAVLIGLGVLGTTRRRSA